MRSSQDIQTEYDSLKNPKGHPGSGGLDPSTDRAYQEAIRRAKLDEQAKSQRDFEAEVDQILHNGPPA